MLFKHMLQQTTHDGDTHVGYFNMAVFAVYNKNTRVMIHTKFYHTWLMHYLSQLESKLLRVNTLIFKKLFKHFFTQD